MTGNKVELNDLYDKTFQNVANEPVESVDRSVWCDLSVFVSKKQSYRYNWT